MAMAYSVYICYHPNDKKIARILLDKLEHYKMSSNIIEGNLILPFMDICDLQMDFLEISLPINQSIFLQFEYMLVVCSPDSAKSPWVDKLIRSFIKLGKERQIIPFIIAGTPNSDNPEMESFAPALRENSFDDALNISLNDLGMKVAIDEVVSFILNQENKDIMVNHKNMELKSAFISHSHCDNEIALHVFDYLSENGIRCWMDLRSIPPGKPYAQAIVEGIKQSDSFIILFSKNVVDSRDILNEIEIAHRENKQIIPFLLDETSIQGQFSYYLSRQQWITAYPDFRKKEPSLLEALNGVIPQPPVSPVPKPVMKSFIKIIFAVIVMIMLIGGFIYWWNRVSGYDIPNTLEAERVFNLANEQSGIGQIDESKNNYKRVRDYWASKKEYTINYFISYFMYLEFSRGEMEGRSLVDGYLDIINGIDRHVNFEYLNESAAKTYQDLRKKSEYKLGLEYFYELHNLDSAWYYMKKTGNYFEKDSLKLKEIDIIKRKWTIKYNKLP